MPKESQPRMSTASLTETTWHGQAAWKLENATLQIIVVPEMGAKIVSLLDKRNQIEWLVGPGGRPFRPAPYGSVFTNQDMSGWDEMFPTIKACQYPNPQSDQSIPLPDHGELWAIPWQRIPTDKPALYFTVEGRALSYSFSRKIEFTAESVLKFTYHAINHSDAPLSALWAAHPQFLSGSDAKVILPPHISRVCNVLPESFGWALLEETMDWPEATRLNGEPVRLDEVGSSELNQARKFYIPPEIKASWIAIVRQPSQNWISLSWDVNEVPYLGIWVDEGYISPESVVAPEPATGYYDSLALAIEKSRHMVIEPGKSVSWSLLVRFGDHETTFL